MDETFWAAAQIVERYGGGPFYVAVYEGLFNRRDIDRDRPELFPSSVINSERVMFLGITLDAKIVSGDWSYLGTMPPPASLPFPAYRVGPDDDCYVEDYTATRRCDCGEMGLLLPYRTVVAPVVVERAVRARHNRIPWDEYYEPLRVAEEWARSSAFFAQT